MFLVTVFLITYIMCLELKHLRFRFYIMSFLLVFVIYIRLSYDKMLHPKLLNIATITIPIPNITLNDTHFSKFKTVIGLGAAKCASTTLKRILQLSTPQYIGRPYHKYKYRYIVTGETNYWLTCHRHIGKYLIDSFQNLSGCNFNEYYNRILITPHLSHYLPRFEGEWDRLIFMEKTPSYFTYYQTSNILTHYANIHKNIYFYVLLRDPIKRLWSHYWMHYLRNQPLKLNPGSILDIYKMENIILNDLNDMRTNYPLFMRLLSLLKNETSSEISRNDILELYDLSQRNEMTIYGSWNEEFPCILKSCYYPILLNWYSLMEKELFEQRFRIIQTEWFVENQQQTVIELLCWVNGGEEYEYDMTKCERNEGGIPKEFANRRRKYVGKMKHAAWSPDIVDVLQLNVSKVLQPFFRDCNHRLYDFINKHPKIVLGNRPFVHFEALNLRTLH